MVSKVKVDDSGVNIVKNTNFEHSFPSRKPSKTEKNACNHPNAKEYFINLTKNFYKKILQKIFTQNFTENFYKKFLRKILTKKFKKSFIQL